MKRLIQSPQQLATILKTTRKARGLTQADVASRLGVSQNRLSELELNTGSLTVSRLLELGRTLGLEISVEKAGAKASATTKGSSSDW